MSHVDQAEPSGLYGEKLARCLAENGMSQDTTPGSKNQAGATDYQSLARK